MSEVTRILDAIQQGDANAAEELLPLVYEELRRLAAHKMANEPPGQTLQPTALVHEAWLCLAGGAAQTWNNREHFFRAAAEAMRHILVDRARQRNARRHGGHLQQTDLSESKAPALPPLAIMDHPNIAKILDAGVTGAPAVAGVSPASEGGI